MGSLACHHYDTICFVGAMRPTYIEVVGNLSTPELRLHSSKIHGLNADGWRIVSLCACVVMPPLIDHSRADRLKRAWKSPRFLAARGLQPGGPQPSELVHPPGIHGRQDMEEGK